MNILEINQKKLSLLDASQLTAFLNIFKGVSNPKAKQIVKDLAQELSTRKTEEVEEASIKDIIKLVKASAKKIGGIIDKVMGDAEFQKAYAKYIDNPNDKDRLKKIQAYTNGLLGDGTSESVQLKKLRIEKVCSIVLGEDFDQDFIYEDVDFTKPSTIKEAYSTYLIEASKGDIKKVLDAAKKAGGTINGNQIDFGMGSVIDVSIEKGKIKLDGGSSSGVEYFKNVKDAIMAFESVDLEEAIKVKTHKGMFSMKKGEESLRNWVDGIVIMSDAVKKNQRKTVAQNIVKAIESGKIKNADLTQDLGALIGIKSPKGMEAPANTVKAKLKDLGLSESTDLEEAVKFWTVTITKKAGKLFKGQTVDVKARNSAEAIKKGLKQMKADPNTVPSGSVDAVLGEAYDSDEKHTMDPKSHVERNKETGMYCVYNVKGKKVKEFESKEDAEEYAIKNHDALMKESTEIEEAKKYEAGKYYAKFGGRVVGPYDTEKDAYRDTKGDVEWIKKGKDINESAEIEEAKSDTQKDIESLKKMIKNPDPKRVKSYGGTKYVDMLKSKLAKLEESTDLEKTNTLTQDEYDEVQNFRNFKERDWKYDKKTKTYIRKNKL